MANEKILETKTGKVFSNISTAAVYFDTNTSSISNSIRYKKEITLQKGKFAKKELKFEKIDENYLNDLMDKKIIHLETSKIMTIKQAAKKFDAPPYKISQSAAFGFCIDYKGTKQHFKELKLSADTAKTVTDSIKNIKDLKSTKNVEEPKLTENTKPIFNKKEYDIFFNNAGQILLVKDDQIVKKIETPAQFLIFFKDKLVEVGHETISEILV